MSGPKVPEAGWEVVDDEGGDDRRLGSVKGDHGVGPRNPGGGGDDLVADEGPAESEDAETALRRKGIERCGPREALLEKGGRESPDADQVALPVDGVVGSRQSLEAGAGAGAEHVSGSGAAGQGDRNGQGGGRDGDGPATQRQGGPSPADGLDGVRCADHAAGSGDGVGASTRPAPAVARTLQVHTPQHTHPGSSRPQKLIIR